MGDLLSLALYYGTDVLDLAKNMLAGRTRRVALEREPESVIAENTQLRRQFGLPPRLRLVTRPQGRES